MSQPDPRPAIQTSPASAAQLPAQEPGPKPIPPWNWRLIVFLWIAALLFLALYELLYSLLRVFR